VSGTAQLSEFLLRLGRRGKLPLAEYPFDEASPQAIGLVVRGGMVELPPGTSLLDAGSVRAALRGGAREWLNRLEIHAAIDSTNLRLVTLPRGEEAGGMLIMAELQTMGRGRRGRQWFSPFAGSLAMSLGFRLQGSPGELGGLSLAVGLGVAAALEDAGVAGVNLKWPNDVRVGDAKICGILIELISVPDAVVAVVGIGVNVSIAQGVRRQVDQPLTDIREQGVDLERSTLAGLVVSSVVEIVDQFTEHGFEPLRSVYDTYHTYHGKQCVLMHGDGETVGKVVGVTQTGQLRIASANGLREFDGGEVSLRGL
jgi:BirA family biotin operon repressor/biotin-[acetyl-CoA-carboxylase] ligase|tara:strand:- start:1333 stop:2268 length:936 start_codon:yes stop_codon:yes gene_type:complete